MQLANIAVTLRRRSPWEAIDLGFAMLRNWWRPVYAAWALTFVPFVALIALGAAVSEKVWLGLLVIWWCKPAYDRMLLHVLSRGVFGETLRPRAVIAAMREWLFTGLFAGLTWERFSTARSFDLPVRQLEGQSGREARARRALLSRRVRQYAFWLTVVCLHFELVLALSQGFLLDLFLPVKAEATQDLGEWWRNLSESFSIRDLLVYSGVISIVEPAYVAAGFALYLNRRTMLEGWDIELALRRIAEERSASARTPLGATIAAACVLSLAALLCGGTPGRALAEEPQATQSPEPKQLELEAAEAAKDLKDSVQPRKDPKQALKEVLSTPEFQQYRDTTRWQWKGGPDWNGSWDWWPFGRSESKSDFSGLGAIGYALAKAVEALLWIGAAVLVALGVWWLYRQLPRYRDARLRSYRPPSALFGLDLAPESLPADVAGTAQALAREGRVREALALLYRGALSELVHGRGVELSSSHTEEEALGIAQANVAPEIGRYFAALVAAWQAVAYARRRPAGVEVERLAHEYAACFAAAAA
jgi:hypothetical protein